MAWCVVAEIAMMAAAWGRMVDGGGWRRQSAWAEGNYGKDGVDRVGVYGASFLSVVCCKSHRTK